MQAIEGLSRPSNFSLSTPRAMCNPLNAELNPICNLLALLGAHHIFHVSGLRVNPLSYHWAGQLLVQGNQES